MKRTIAALLAAVMLAGCSTGQQIDQPMELRRKLCETESTFDAVITADYGEKVYVFSMKCQADAAGNLSFEVSDPETISGITGHVTEQEGALTFDDKVLAFPLLSEGQLTPVSGPWHLIHTLRSGYIAGSGPDEELVRVYLDDSYREDTMHVDVWLDSQGNPVRGEILWKGRRILTIDIRNFAFQ